MQVLFSVHAWHLSNVSSADRAHMHERAVCPVVTHCRARTCSILGYSATEQQQSGASCTLLLPVIYVVGVLNADTLILPVATYPSATVTAILAGAGTSMTRKLVFCHSEVSLDFSETSLTNVHQNIQIPVQPLQDSQSMSYFTIGTLHSRQ